MSLTPVRALKKVRPITLEQLDNYKFRLFGNGGFAKNIRQKFGQNIITTLDYTNSDCASGIVVLGTGNGQYQYNQLKALDSVADNIEAILLLDDNLHSRGLENKCCQKKLIIFEHADGVVRHAAHLSGFRNYLRGRGIQPISVCPNTLFYYPELFDSDDICVWGGQRELYQVINEVFPERKKTYIEFGFFPQVEHVYFDKLGVNQNCSLMFDNLNWIETSHISKLNDCKKKFLREFKPKKTEYVLVPLQVPDDANILNCSRFNNGMQEFIDYIVDYYPSNERILFKAHPKDPFQADYDYRGRECSNLPFLKLLEGAKHVHGITSSCLYEAVMAGIDIIAEGNSLLTRHAQQHEQLLAAMVDRQINVKESELTEYLYKNSHLTL